MARITRHYEQLGATHVEDAQFYRARLDQLLPVPGVAAEAGYTSARLAEAGFSCGIASLTGLILMRTTVPGGVRMMAAVLIVGLTCFVWPVTYVMLWSRHVFRLRRLLPPDA